MSERHFEDSSLAENYEKYRLQYTDLGIEDNVLTFLREELKEVDIFDSHHLVYTHCFIPILLEDFLIRGFGAMSYE